MTMLAEMTLSVECFWRERGIGTEDRLRLTRIIEDLFTKTVVHDHRGDAEAPIHVSPSMDGDDGALLYEDSAPSFDPLAAVSVDPRAHAREVGSRPSAVSACCWSTRWCATPAMATKTAGTACGCACHAAGRACDHCANGFRLEFPDATEGQQKASPENSGLTPWWCREGESNPHGIATGGF